MKQTSTDKTIATISDTIAQFPLRPGVYLFKAPDGTVLYVGKAKRLRDRTNSYLLNYGKEWKATAILDASKTIESVETESDLEAMLLEARLIQSYQPRFNTLLKTGQVYTYFLITGEKRPRFLSVRQKKQKGQYFGPFIEHGSSQRAFSFLQEQFQLRFCGRTIPGGCLQFHMGKCAGSCRDDFDERAYCERIELVRTGLSGDKALVLNHLDQQIEQANSELLFERSAQLVKYKSSFERLFESLSLQFDRPQSIQKLADADIWVTVDGEREQTYLFLYKEKRGVVTQSRLFCFIGEHNTCREYIESYYRTHQPAQIILSSIIWGDQKETFQKFLTEWYSLAHQVSYIDNPALKQKESLVLAQLHANEYCKKRENSGKELKLFLKMAYRPETVDCFDISHKQGHAMVGSAVRFTNGVPDKKAFRHFIIKTVDGQNDYASLQEIVQRRYKSRDDLPDVIVIDGGKGQLSAVREVLDPLLAGTKTELVSLAKREETIFSGRFPEGKRINQKSLVGHLLIALRDYAHHFAITFHRKKFKH